MIKVGQTMSAVNDKTITSSRPEWVGNESNTQKYEFFNKVKTPLANGRVNAILRVDQPDSDPGTSIQLRKVFFSYYEATPSFFLIAEGEDQYAGTELWISGDGLEAGKTYTISGGLEHVDAWLGIEGVTTDYGTTPQGTFTVISFDAQSIGGYFRFRFSNIGHGDNREIDFFCTHFVINF